MKTIQFRAAEKKLTTKAKKMAEKFIELDMEFAELESQIDEKGLVPQLGHRPVAIAANAKAYLTKFRQAEGNTIARSKMPPHRLA